MTQAKKFTGAWKVAIVMLVGAIMCAGLMAFGAVEKAHAFESKCVTITSPANGKTYQKGVNIPMYYEVLDPYTSNDIQASVYLTITCNGKQIFHKFMGGVDKGSSAGFVPQPAWAPVWNTVYINDVCKYAGSYVFKLECYPYNLKTKKIDTSIAKSKYPSKTVRFKIVAPPKKGTVLSSSQATYKVTKAGEEVAYVGPKNKKASSAVVSAQVKFGGYTYKVTSIANNAFKGNKKISKVTIGKNVKTIGSKAFYGCSKLKNIVLKSTELYSIKSKAFTGMYKKATIKMLRANVEYYRPLFTAKTGFSSKMTLAAI